jgi:hypothetical protein
MASPTEFWLASPSFRSQALAPEGRFYLSRSRSFTLMASGKTHLRVEAAAGVLLGGVWMAAEPVRELLSRLAPQQALMGFAAGYVFSMIWLSPDLDLEHCDARRRWGPLGLPVEALPEAFLAQGPLARPSCGHSHATGLLDRGGGGGGRGAGLGGDPRRLGRSRGAALGRDSGLDARDGGLCSGLLAAQRDSHAGGQRHPPRLAELKVSPLDLWADSANAMR